MKEEINKNIKVETTRNRKAKIGECLGTIVVIIGLFSFLASVPLGAIVTIIGLVIFLYGRFNE